MPSESEYIAAANKAPSKRSASEQALVDQGQNLQSVRNADHAARQDERFNW